MPPFSVVGTSVPRIEGDSKVTGAAEFAADVALPGLLWGGVYRGPIPHGRIVRLDVSRARALPGVHAVLTASETGEVLVGKVLRDMPLLCADVVRFVGDPIAAVAAESPEVLAEALSLIEVEFDELSAVFEPDEATAAAAPVLHPNYDRYPGAVKRPDLPNIQSQTVFGKGDVEAGLAEADLVFEHTFTTSRVHQAYVEPKAAVVRVEPDGQVTVWSSSKVPYTVRELFCELFGLEQERVVLVPTRIGGDFGGKNMLGPELVAYVLARATGRPVKVVNSYVEEFQAGNPRHPGTITIRTGVKRDGTLTARDVRIVFNGGAYGANRVAPGVGLPSVVKAPGPYRMPHARVVTTWVYTNTVPSGIMRAPAQPQVVFASEVQVDMIAEALGMDPLELRLKNVLQEGDTWPTGERYEDVRGRETLELARRASGWGAPLGPNRGRGIAMSDRPINAAPSGITLSVDADGSLTAVSGIPDVGTGAYTILKQVVAEELGLPLDAVTVVHGDTSTALFDAGIGGSKTTFSSTYSVFETTTALKARLSELAAEKFECAIEDVQFEGGAFSVRGNPGRRLELLELGREAAARAGGRLVFEAAGPKGRPPQSCFVVNVVEAAVDPETGQVSVEKVVAVHDVGFAINPQLTQAQVDGAVVQALGFATMEEVPTAEGGNVAVVSFNDYKIPTTADIPTLVCELLEDRSGPGRYGAKAIGEAPLTCLAPALSNAIHQATGVRLTRTPITAERVWKALQERSAVS